MTRAGQGDNPYRPLFTPHDDAQAWSLFFPRSGAILTTGPGVDAPGPQSCANDEWSADAPPVLPVPHAPHTARSMALRRGLSDAADESAPPSRRVA